MPAWSQSEVFFQKSFSTVKPRFNLNSYGKRAFSVAAPDLWNPLPQDIKSSCTVDIFECKLKTHLFTLAFNLQHANFFILCFTVVAAL